ncbi:rhomboid-related protein 1 [Pyrgilauda ruficollis]|uniref:rhomboid-related protein 1 n=1 Tax=Pyrgilauda ruficollis TaxID=221976 RepID=UPI001B86D3A5|nr:rhomboid-related protein 1 [Pyrgilauda ruficollis]
MDRSSLLQLIQEQLDPENTGFIGVETFASLVHSHELPLDPAKLDMLVALAQGNDEGQVCYQELVDLISSKRSSSFKRAIANGQRALPRDVLLDETGLGIYKRFVRYVAYEILPCEMDRRWYFYQHRTCPPPVFMAAVTLTQIIVFLCYGARLNKWVLQTYHPEYMKSPLVYHPGHRARAWRFLTYMFMHVGLEQLGFNALLQLMIGVPLEMVHGILRISFLYLAGVLAGSLTVSITDMRAPLVGGSGGVYALCSAHLANVVMGGGRLVAPQDLHFHKKDWCQKRSDLFFYAKININKRKRNLTKRRIWGEPGRNQLRPAQLILAVPSAAQPPPRAPAPRSAASRPPGTGLAAGWGRGGSPL